MEFKLKPAELITKLDLILPDDESSLELLAALKWKNGFVCRHCGNTNSCNGKSIASRRCTRCKREESATAHTVFHHCRFSLKQAMEISMLICHFPDISSYELSRQLQLRHMTCYNFQKKMLACVDENDDTTLLKELLEVLDNRVHADERP